MPKLFILPSFLAAFGLLFIFAGAQRLWNASRDQKAMEAIVWGSVGIVLGLAGLAAAGWWFWGNARFLQ